MQYGKADYYNPIYLGNLVQMRTTTVSYKNKKMVKRDPEDMVTVYNTHEAIVSQELWDKCREMEASVSQGKKNEKRDYTPAFLVLYSVVTAAPRCTPVGITRGIQEKVRESITVKTSSAEVMPSLENVLFQSLHQDGHFEQDRFGGHSLQDDSCTDG